MHAPEGGKTALLLVLATALCLLPIQTTALASPTLEANLVTLGHATFPFIYMHVAVRRDGTYIDTLTRANFEVRENGVMQTDYFEVTPPEASGGVRIADIVFVLDVTGSMREEIEAVRANMLAFVNALAASDIDYRVGFVVFGDIVHQYNSGNLYASQSEILDIVNDIRLGEHGIGTGGDPPENQFGALAAAAAMNFRPGAQKVLILLTDAHAHEANSVTPWTRESIRQHLVSAGVVVFPVFDTSSATQRSQYIPIAQATNSDGSYFDISADFTSILGMIRSVVAATYIVRYRSSRPIFDGVSRRVVVRVTYLGEVASCEGSYTPGSGPTIRRTARTVGLHDQAWAAGTQFTIEAEITDAVAPYVRTATLYYRTTGSTTYTVTSMTKASGEVWTANIPGSSVRTPGVDYYISATDGESSATSPPVDPTIRPHQLAILPNEAPRITHTPVTTARLGAPVTIVAVVTDTTNRVASVELWYRRTGELLFASNGPMRNTSGDSFQGTIPSAYVTELGVQYYIVAYDDLGVGNHHGSFSKPHDIKVTTAAGTVTGRVTDASTGKGIVGAVILLDPDPFNYCPITLEDGRFSFDAPPGTYNITVDAEGYRAHTKTGVTVTIGQTTTVNFALSPVGPAVEGLVVTVADHVRVREAPGTKAGIITTLRRGSPLELIAHADNGKWADDYRWWHVKFGVLRGWIAGVDSQGRWFISEFTPESQKPTIHERTYHTAYNVALEAELRGDETKITNPPGAEGTFYKEFLYSARGVCMQGSGQAVDGRTIELVSGDGRWVNSAGQEVCYNTSLGYVLCNTQTRSAPHWVKNEGAQVFGELPEGVFKGAFGRISPWHTIAVDKDRIPLGSVVYIPKFAGTKVGEEVISGYFHAVDVGGAIRAGEAYDARIDVFVGAGKAAMEGWTNFTGSVKVFDATRWPVQVGTLLSPGELRVYDSHGRVTGIVDGRILTEIPDSVYHVERSEVVIVFPEDSFDYVVFGTETGNYSLLVESDNVDQSQKFLARSIRTARGAVHRYTIDWDALERGEKGVTIQIDQDGDGVFEKSIQAGSEFTGDELKHTITATAATGGEIAPSGAVAVIHGSDQTFVITPDSSHVIHDVLVDGSSVLSQVVMDGRVGSYTFVNVTRDHTIHAAFAAVPPGAAINHGPNPVPATGCTFWFSLPDGTRSAKLMVYNVAGRLVVEITLDPTTTRYPTAGRWNPVDRNGVPLANGPYVYVLIADGRVLGQGKMVIQR